jgi:hypothetical protein
MISHHHDIACVYRPSAGYRLNIIVKPLEGVPDGGLCFLDGDQELG